MSTHTETAPATTPARTPLEHLGLVIEFVTPDALLVAAAKVRDAGWTKWDCHTPFPVHGLDKAMGVKPTILPWIVFGGGLTGACAGLILQLYTNGVLLPFSLYRIRKKLPDGPCYGFVFRGSRGAAESGFPLLTSIHEYGALDPFAYQLRLKNNSGHGFWAYEDKALAQWSGRPWQLALWKDVPRVWQLFLLNEFVAFMDLEALVTHNHSGRATARRIAGLREQTLAALRAFLSRYPEDLRPMLRGTPVKTEEATSGEVKYGSALWFQIKKETSEMIQRRAETP